VHAPPAIGKDHTLCVGSNDAHMHALNPDGTQNWRFLTDPRVDNCCAAIGNDGTIHCGSDDNYIYALNEDG
jgi:outer membrane protein assembly factor BamB